MELKKLEVPTTSITEVKRSPMEVFEQAKQEGTAVYVFNREKVAGVMLTQNQYETLLKELDELREKPSATASVQKVEEESFVDAGLEELYQKLQKSLMTESSISAKVLDEKMVSHGFITRKTGFGGVTDMIDELKRTEKIGYQLRQKPEGKNVIAEIVGKQDKTEHLLDHVVIEKIYLKAV
ncbi:type II toxin-antitoxin system Phd/YefM family antitoxin [Tetragenococcus koreensis]|uniref:Prevent-host-death protein n=1 Tax=Tetragenococcus koreensis TaxID=290335 RepID=A0AAN4UCM0_9ENTE|nr:type II toxin-antitoxin system Phd/YefM family antitoxin [Tetragenococcus koreensis]AYW44548.1 prevent-host-death protein [Tetragenococcus koreensis]MCF1584209.1 type II toxin-antitoxin system Phd/YefM family antitoxin [Tetragenococcus koreensis]MCF1613857.1 type II toxin-antitoxin system Phd/YefM family antitoxin [Tetragenococcus koreensis]MCF1617730.1 type II toxin-antitoxin system Phd/YefM family antitoxin [Tetragenococcus koreensis]MCF1619567.1 type II toxin-antitoxin system Phd/YefM fa